MSVSLLTPGNYPQFKISVHAVVTLSKRNMGRFRALRLLILLVRRGLNFHREQCSVFVQIQASVSEYTTHLTVTRSIV